MLRFMHRGGLCFASRRPLGYGVSRSAHAYPALVDQQPTNVFIISPKGPNANASLTEAIGLCEAVAGWSCVENMQLTFKPRIVIGKGQLEIINDALEPHRSRLLDVTPNAKRWDEHENADGHEVAVDEHVQDTAVETGTYPQQLAVFINTPSLAVAVQNKLQDAWGVPVLDRFNLVLRIFRSRAQSRQSILRLDLAALDYERSRLVDSSAGLDQQRGGTHAMSGAGEKAISISRSNLTARAATLKDELADLLAREDGMRQRKRQRAADSGRSIPVVAIVGYTNAGKSLLICMATACL